MNKDYRGYKVLKAQPEEGTEAAKIFFFCHEADFEEHAEGLFGDVRQVLPNSDFFFLENGIVPESEGETKEYYFADAACADVILFAVTKRFLRENNFACNEMLPFAIENKLRFLPVFLEQGLEAEFDAAVGNYHCISKVSTDVTEIPYIDKLKMYFDSVVPSDDLRRKVKESFKSYIFISYRKKDRQYVRRVMKHIHCDEQYVDSAIWYDEFLIPGEDFNDSIEENFLKSNLIVLLVTPNILEDPNYVMTTEYPMALTHRKKVLPIETVFTDRDKLHAKYEGIGNDILQLSDEKNSAPWNTTSFQSAIEGINEEKLFLLGNAYLYGIDVENDVDRAIVFLNKAKEKGYYLAGFTLSFIYELGMTGTVDYDQAYNSYYDYFMLFLDRYNRGMESDDRYFESALKLSDLALLASKEMEVLDFLKEIYSTVHEDYKNNPGKKELVAVIDTLERLSECAEACGNEYALNYLDDWLDFINIYEIDFGSEELLSKRMKCLTANAKYDFAYGYYGLMLDRLDEIFDIYRQHEGEYAYYIEGIRARILYHVIWIRCCKETAESAEYELNAIHNSLKQTYLDNGDIVILELLVENGLACFDAMNSGLISEESVINIVDDTISFVNEYKEHVNSVRCNYICLKTWNALAYLSLTAGYKNNEKLSKYVETCCDFAGELSDSLNITDYGREYAFTLYLKGLLHKLEGNSEQAMEMFLKAKKQFDLTPGLRKKTAWSEENDGIVCFASLNIYTKICIELINGYVNAEDWEAVKKLAKEFVAYDHDSVLLSDYFEIIVRFESIFNQVAEVCTKLHECEAAEEFYNLCGRYSEVSSKRIPM